MGHGGGGVLVGFIDVVDLSIITENERHMIGQTLSSSASCLRSMLTGLGIRVLAGTCGLLRYSCGNPKLSRRDADDPLEVKGKMALVREADAECDLRQAKLAICP